jgi:PLP dependent protein
LTGDDELESLRSARATILRRVAEAAALGGRDRHAVKIVAVSKTVAADRVVAAAAAGFEAFGENRVQERAAKAEGLEGMAGEWHLVGPLQSNKARRAVELFDVIQTVDSLDLARRLDRLTAELRPRTHLRVLLQANVDDDPAKSGFDPADLERDLAAILELEALEVEGLMTVGRQVESAEDARPTFAALRALSERLRDRHRGLGAALSMGMTEDYPVAVEEGATIVRIGRAIFGERPLAR